MVAEKLRARIVDLHSTGMRVRNIALKLHQSESCVYYHLKKHKILTMLAEEKTPEEICEALNLTPQTFRNFIRLPTEEKVEQ